MLTLLDAEPEVPTDQRRKRMSFALVASWEAAGGHGFPAPGSADVGVQTTASARPRSAAAAHLDFAFLCNRLVAPSGAVASHVMSAESAFTLGG